MKFCQIVSFFLLAALATPVLRAQNPDAEFYVIADEFVRGYLAFRPVDGTDLGLHEYDGKVTEFTRLALDAEISRLRRFDDRLRKFDQTKLGQRASVDLRLLQAAIRKELFEMIDIAVHERSPDSYIRALDLIVYIQRDFAPLEDRIRSLIAIQAQVPNIVIAAKTNLTEALPAPYIEIGIQSARGLADFLRKDLVAAGSTLRDGKLRDTFMETNRKAAQALIDYAAWLERDKVPKATPAFAVGEEKYRKFLAETELVDVPPARILEIGLEQLKAEQAAFAEAAAKIDASKTPPDVFAEIKKEHPPADKLIADVTKDLEDIRKFVLQKKLVTIPSEVRAKVKETPQYRRATTFAAMDTAGPFEKKATDSYYYVTPPDASWPEPQREQWLTFFNTYSSDVVSIHEAYPGHYTQFQHVNATQLNRVAKVFRSYAFVEGWAHYTEKMMLDEGFGATAPAGAAPEEAAKRAAKYRMAQAAAAMRRLCRLIVSIRMHTQNLSIDDATQFFRQNCYMEEKPARSEALRGTTDLGYLHYTLGKLMILKLREDYRAQEGENFSLPKFHQQILSHGSPQIRLLRELMLKDQAKWGEIL